MMIAKIRRSTLAAALALFGAALGGSATAPEAQACWDCESHMRYTGFAYYTDTGAFAGYTCIPNCSDATGMCCSVRLVRG